MTKHMQITVLEPATNHATYDTVDNKGIEAHILANYNVTFDSKNNQWVAGRADGTGATLLDKSLPSLMKTIGILTSGLFEE